jgi:hypothetical protein
VISEKIGTTSKKNMKTKLWWIKLGLALILSNIFFFILFKNEQGPDMNKITGTPEGWVEVQLEAHLLTPFQSGKKVLIVHRNARKKLEGVLQANGADELGRITVLVKETEANALFQYSTWEVLPYLKHLTFASVTKETGHEIRY